MVNHGTFHRFLAIALSCILVTGLVPLAACSTDTAEGDEGVSLAYRSDGDYTVTLPKSYGSYEDITADQVTVSYLYFDAEGYDKALAEQEAAAAATEENPASADESTTGATDASAAENGASGTVEENLEAAEKAAQEVDTEEAAEGEATEEAAEGEGAGEESFEDPLVAEYTSEKTAEVLDFTVNKDGTATLHFLDSATRTEFTPTYGVNFADKDFGVPLIVDFVAFKLTPDVSSVLSTSTTNKITLTLDDSQFASDITADDILLYGGFEGMTIESLSSAGKNLTMQLTGAPLFNERSGAYLDGFISIAPTGIENAFYNTNISIPVEAQAAYLDVANLEVNGDDLTIPLTLIDVADLSTLTPESVTLTPAPGATTNDLVVKDLKQESDNQVVLTVSGADTSSKNAAARSLMYRDVNVGDFTFTSNVVDASFYPVFDYVEEDGDNFAITLELYVSSGTFADSLKDSAVTLGQGFEGGKVKSIERTGDETAELKIEVPTNGQSAEDLNINGEVILAAGTLVNAWGEPTEELASYLRDYTQDSLGRVTETGPGTPSEIEQLTAAINSFGSTQGISFFDIATNVVSGGASIYSLLQSLELVPSQFSQTLETLDKIQSSVEKLQTSVDYQTNMLESIQREQYNSRQSSFDTELLNLLTDCEYLDTYFRKAEQYIQLPEVAGVSAQPVDETDEAQVETSPSSGAGDVSLDEDVVSGDLVQSWETENAEPNLSGQTGSNELALDAQEESISSVNSSLSDLPEEGEAVVNGEIEDGEAVDDESEMTRALTVTDLPTETFDYSKQPKDWSEYNAMVVSYIVNHQNDAAFIGFRERFAKLQDRYDNLATQLSKTGQNNPIASYDTLCSLSFNFDTEAYDGRMGVRTLSKYALKQALCYIILVYNNEAQCNPAKSLYTKAEQTINSIPVGAKPGDGVIYYYTLGKYITNQLALNELNDYALYNYGGSRKYRGFITHWDDSPGAVASGHMSDEQMNSFVKRMGGKTIDVVLQRAGINRNPDAGWKKNDAGKGSAGLALNSYVVYKRPSGIKKIFCDQEDQYYSSGIKWGESTLTKDVLTYMWEFNSIRDLDELYARYTYGPMFEYFVPA